MLILLCTDWSHKLHTSHGDFMYVCDLGLSFANTTPLKSLSSTCDVRSFSLCTDSSHKLPDMHYFIFEQIDLHILNVLYRNHA